MKPAIYTALGIALTALVISGAQIFQRGGKRLK